MGGWQYQQGIAYNTANTNRRLKSKQEVIIQSDSVCFITVQGCAFKSLGVIKTACGGVCDCVAQPCLDVCIFGLAEVLQLKVALIQ